MASPNNRTIAVFGASGHTGRFVVSELLRRGFTPLAISRSTSKPSAFRFEERGVAVRTASIEDPSSLDRAFAGAAAVINCAGPFLDTAEPVAGAALRTRIHYLDVTAEQPSALATLEQFGAASREAGVIVVPAMGFYGGFGDLLATAAMGDWDYADEISLGIALDSWWPTLGTRKTGERNTARRLTIIDRKLAPMTLPLPQTSLNFPEPFGRQDVTEIAFSEVILMARHLKVSRLRTYLNNTPLQDIHDDSTPPPVAADETGRSSQIFLVDAIVRKGSDTRRATARGRDIYAFTAPLVVEAVRRILDAEISGSGALAPGELFDAKRFLEALVPEHLELEIKTE